MCDSEASPTSRVRIGSLPRRYDAVDGQRLRHPGVEAGPYHGDQATTHIHHAGEEAFVCLEGDLSVTIEGTRTRVPPGGYVIVPRGAPHTLATPGGAHVLAVMSPDRGSDPGDPR